MVKLKTAKRLVAYKAWIRDIVTAPYVQQAGWEPNYIELAGVRVSRVNLLASVVGKFVSEDGNYATITLDDGTETIRSKAFGPDVIKLKDTRIGSLVRFIGKIKNYNEETYLAPEIVREVEDPNWIIVRQLELGLPRTEQKKIVKMIPTEVAEEVIEEEGGINRTTLEIIKKLDKGQGADMTQVIKKMDLDESEAKNVLVGLLKAGECFEPLKGKLKVLE